VQTSNMAAAADSDNVFWHTNLKVLPHLQAEVIDNFISANNVVKETSIRGYKFFLEGFVHDVEGKL